MLQPPLSLSHLSSLQFLHLLFLIIYNLCQFHLQCSNMETCLLTFFTFFALALATHAALSPELYWNSMLTNSPMAKDLTEEKHVSVVGNGRLNVQSDDGKDEPTDTSVDVGKGGVNVDTGRGKKDGTPAESESPFNYRYAASETQLHSDPTAALFFLEKDLQPGTNMNLQFTNKSNAARFLPLQVAKSIPFSSNKFPEILNKLAVKPGSAEADTIKKTIEACESPAIKGEDKYCATSLESMMNFTTSKLGKKVHAISTKVDRKTALQKYTITHKVKKMGDAKSVVCHKQKYPYAVFYCHVTETTRAYVVPLEGFDGTKAQAVAVCHSNTSEWNPKHLAFQVLHVKPGTVPVCHFLPEDHIVWVRN